MRHTTLTLLLALCTTAPLAGCGPIDWSDAPLDVEGSSSDPFDSGSYTVGQLGAARFQTGDGCALLSGPCDLTAPFMAGMEHELWVDVLDGRDLAAVASSNPAVMSVALAAEPYAGHPVIDLYAQAGGEAELELLDAGGAPIDRVTVEVRQAAAVRWGALLEEAPPVEQRDGDGELGLLVGQTGYLFARPVDDTGRILGALGANGFALVASDGAVTGEQTAPGELVYRLVGVKTGEAVVRADIGPASALITVHVGP